MNGKGISFFAKTVIENWGVRVAAEAPLKSPLLRIVGLHYRYHGISHVLEHDLTGMRQVNAYFEQFVINHQHHFQRCPRCPRVNVGQGCGYLCVLLLFYIYYYALSPDYDGPKTSIVTLQSSMTPTTAPTRIVRL